VRIQVSGESAPPVVVDGRQGVVIEAAIAPMFPFPAQLFRVVAAADASAEVRKAARYVCDGVADQVQIQGVVIGVMRRY
jgi:hypothetical protein